MASMSESILAFNRGLISRLGLARSDVKRLALAATTMTNWIPRVLGSMSIRPGLGYIGATKSNLAERMVPFKFSVSDTAMLEFTNLVMRVWIDDALLARAAVSSAVSNGTFTQYTDTVTITVASPAVVTYTDTDDIWTDDDTVSFSSTGTLPTGLSAGVTYYVINLVAGANTFEVSATSGGAAINTTAAGSGTISAEAYDYIASWTDNDEASTRSDFVNANTPGGPGLRFIGNGTNAAIRDQTVTVAVADQGTLHSLAIVIANGPVVLRVGTSTSDDSYIPEVELETGVHSLAFTPTGNFNIRFQNRLDRAVIVTSCDVGSSGTLEVVTTFATADLDNIRFDQSGDIIFVSCSGQRQSMIQRRDDNSWSVVRYYTKDGPWGFPNVGPITITPSAIVGNITLTASAALFRSAHATSGGALFKLVSSGQNVVTNVAAAVTTYTDAIRVIGVDSSRVFTIVITGVTATTVTLQRSLTAATGPWETAQTFTADTVETYDDGLDNQITWYRIGVDAGDYGGADNIDLTLNYELGSIVGFARVTSFTSSTVVTAEVLKDLGDNVATDVWTEGSWSDRTGWPQAIAFHENRLWFAGKGEVWGSVSNAFTSYDDTIEGDTGPINRLIATGGTDTINWLVSGQRLLAGAQEEEYSGKSSSFDEPVTPTAFALKPVGTQGSSFRAAAKVDSDAVFIGRTGTKIYEMAFSAQSLDYQSDDLTKLIPDLGQPEIVRLGIQRQPDTRIHGVRSDGKVILGVFDKVEEVLCWTLQETDGSVEDVVVFPADVGSEDDQVYYVVNRTIDGSTVRYIEKMAQQDVCLGANLSYLADSFVLFTVPSGTPTVTITGLSHLEGENVVVWADGADVGTDSSRNQLYTVSGGQITLAAAVSNAIVGMPYSAPWKSAKLGNQFADGSGIGRVKNIDHIGLLLADTHTQGLRYGPSFSVLDEKPQTEAGTIVDSDTVDTDYDEEDIEFPGEWTADMRICLQADAPRPCTVLGVSMLWTGSR